MKNTTTMTLREALQEYNNDYICLEIVGIKRLKGHPEELIERVEAWLDDEVKVDEDGADDYDVYIEVC